VAAGAAVVGAGLAGRRPRPLDAAATAALYARPLPAPAGGLRVFHLGHSLVGRAMPEMLAALAPAGHGWEAQLGWGATLRAHWEGPDAVPGFAAENAHPRFREAGEAVDSGAYDAVVVTEMVEIRDAIRWHEPAEHLALWARRAIAARPGVRLFLYETWHRLDDPEGWLERIDRDLVRHWEDQVLRPALARLGGRVAIHVIPAGQALARFVRAVEARGGVEGVASRADLFARGPDGAADPIHLNDLGNYLVALAHYAVLYQRDPRGARFRLAAHWAAPTADAAALMQDAVWQAVRAHPKTGLPGGTT
jgi:hypothetical protein